MATKRYLTFQGLPWVKAKENIIKVPLRIQRLFNLPRYFEIKVEESYDEDHFFINVLPVNKPKGTISSAVEQFTMSNAGNPSKGKLPGVHSKNEEATYFDGIYHGSTALITCSGHFYGTAFMPYGVAICDTFQYLEMLLTLNPEHWSISLKLAELHEYFKQLQLKKQPIKVESSAQLETNIILG